MALFCAFLVEKGNKSSTIRSHVSAIKSVLKTDGYTWNDDLILLDAIVKSCKLVNDTVYHRLPIQKGLLELVLFELERLYVKQGYLEILYKAIFLLGYYGLLRVGELAFEGGENKMNHAVKACDIHVGQNKPKILVVLYSSKTHGRESQPQTVKIKQNKNAGHHKHHKAHFCQFQMLRCYMKCRGDYATNEEQLFIFQDGSRVRPSNIRRVLRTCLKQLGLDDEVYDVHSLRIGRASQLIKLNFSVEEVKRAGRWKNNAVYKYIK